MIETFESIALIFLIAIYIDMMQGSVQNVVNAIGYQTYGTVIGIF